VDPLLWHSTLFEEVSTHRVKFEASYELTHIPGMKGRFYTAPFVVTANNYMFTFRSDCILYYGPKIIVSADDQVGNIPVNEHFSALNP
jgi:hypothetical protein